MFRFNYICIISDKVQEILVLGNRSGLVMCQGYCGKQRPCVSFGGKVNELISVGRKTGSLPRMKGGCWRHGA